MPIIVAGVPTAPPAPPHVSDAPPFHTYVTWKPAGLSERTLSWPAAAALRRGALGLDMPPDEYFETELAVSDGSLLQSRRAVPREVTLPIVLATATTKVEMEQQRRLLLRDFDPRLGDGELGWALPDGSRRILFCRYVSGLESQTIGRLHPRLDSQYEVILRAADPYWYGDQASFTFTVATGQPFLPGPPFYISESTTLGTLTVSIDGEVDTYPEWLITGPAASATLTNVDTGKSLSLSPNLAAGQTLLVRTDPRTLAGKKFTNSAGVNVWAAVAGQFPQLWPLRPGSNTVTIALGGSTSASSIRLTYRPRYLSA